MSDVTLDIQINQEGLDFFNKYNEQVIVIRPYSDDYDPKVVCASLEDPLQTSSIKFLDSWSEYASQQPINPMQKINMQTTQKVDIGQTCVFTNSGFSGVNNNCPLDMFGFSNQRTSSPSITCGLAQELSINNGESQLFATCVNATPGNQTTYFESTAIIWILAASGVSSQMILPSSMLQPSEAGSVVTSGVYLEIDLNKTTTVHFDNKTHSFQKGAYSQ